MAKTHIGMRNFGKHFSRITNNFPKVTVLSCSAAMAAHLCDQFTTNVELPILFPHFFASLWDFSRLLLSQEEFDDVVRRSQKVMLDSGLQDFVFDSTAGHVGAITGMLDVLSFRVSGL